MKRPEDRRLVKIPRPVFDCCIVRRRNGAPSQSGRFVAIPCGVGRARNRFNIRRQTQGKLGERAVAIYASPDPFDAVK
jgi:hypothetical protein